MTLVGDWTMVCLPPHKYSQKRTSFCYEFEGSFHQNIMKIWYNSNLVKCQGLYVLVECHKIPAKSKSRLLWKVQATVLFHSMTDRVETPNSLVYFTLVSTSRIALLLFIIASLTRFSIASSLFLADFIRLADKSTSFKCFHIFIFIYELTQMKATDDHCQLHWTSPPPTWYRKEKETLKSKIEFV